ncbi:hypothetical protein MBLNU459_g6550t1 [Dothideomycetes sp. NU459]
MRLVVNSPGEFEKGEAVGSAQVTAVVIVWAWRYRHRFLRYLVLVLVRRHVRPQALLNLDCYDIFQACYVDNDEPRKFSVAVDLKDVDRPEFYAGFLKSSAKITLYPKPQRPGSLAIRSPVPAYATPGSASSSIPPTRYGSPDGSSANIESVKFSFRAGGEKIFFERLKGALVQRKWLLQGAPPVPTPGINTSSSFATADGITQQFPRSKVVGIAGLERRGLELRKNNELVIGSAFEDLEALMTSAKEVIAMAERFAAQNSGNGTTSAEASALLSDMGLVTTRDMLSKSGGSETLYITELSRNLAEYLTDDARGVLRREGGIISLVDLWAVFNRTRNGIELVSPLDFEKAAQMWDQLRLPIRLRRFKSGLLVVQGRDRTDDKTVASLLAWLKELHNYPPEIGIVDDFSAVVGPAVTWDWRAFGRGVTAQETAERFGWSVGVASEELEMAEERGALCREQGVDGVRFWENHFATIEVDIPKPTMSTEEIEQREMRRRMKEFGLL